MNVMIAGGFGVSGQSPDPVLLADGPRFSSSPWMAVRRGASRQLDAKTPVAGDIWSTRWMWLSPRWKEPRLLPVDCRHETGFP